MANRLKLLTGGAKNLPERQRTLRNAIAWSYDLLGEGEKVLFGRLGIFSGGATLEAMEAVCDAPGDLALDAFDGASSLVDKSLLRLEEGSGGEPRFAMLETVREYARERLEQGGEAEAIRLAHAEYFLALAEEAEPELFGPREAEWLDRLDEEHDNIRAALSWSLAGKHHELALGIAGAIWVFWHRHGSLSEGLRWLDEGLAKGGGASAVERAKALEGIGWLMN